MSSLSFVSTSSFRNVLMGKNLPPYFVPGIYTPNIITNYEPQINNFNVIDSPGDDILKNKYSKDLYPLNVYGPDGGFGSDVVTINNPLTQTSNQGEYSDNKETRLDVIYENNIDIGSVPNKYSPEGGFLDMVSIEDLQNNGKLYLPYWSPPSFNNSTYRPFEILNSNNPTGSNGNLSQDSFIAKIGAESLKKLFEERIAVQTNKLLNATNFDAISDRFNRNQIASGQQLINEKNWRITLPENPIITSQEFQARLAGVYVPLSPIPGDYFNENDPYNTPSKQVTGALNVINKLTGGFLGPILNIFRNPSQIFLANTGNGQRSALFLNIGYNKYQPGYDRNYGGRLVSERFVSLIQSLVNPDSGAIIGGYYVGSKDNDPSMVVSPPNQVPVAPNGKQIMAPVYGPSELGILYEGNENKLNFGLQGKALEDGGSIDGGFVWTSPKYGGAAGYSATIGGGIGQKDDTYNEISSTYDRDKSTLVTFRESSILDQTQRLIDSADNVSGGARLKHVGNAINQVSKVFNDGYKEMTKGSQVIKYKDFTTGAEKGEEYCRVFTKDTPYYTFSDLQKTDGITTSGRRFTNSILDNTYNLNISPLKAGGKLGSTNLKANDRGVTVAKKYMFSIENLAWRTSSRPGFTYDELPECEKGPNGGRVMWFPPYDIKFSDSSTASWTPTDFMGRPEPIYTYKSTTRSGTLSWKIIVDSPSVLNLIVEQQLKGANKERVNSILDSFFAGCTKFDIYDLAKEFNRIPSSDLYLLQTKLNKPNLTPEELNAITKTIPVENTNGNTKDGTVNPDSQKTNDNKDVDDFKSKNIDFAYYFENDIPASGTDSYQSAYDKYIGQKNLYIKESSNIFTNNCTPQSTQFCNRNKNTGEFFDLYVKDNYNYLTTTFVQELENILKQDKGSFTIYLTGSASAVGKEDYNEALSKRRVDSIEKFYKETNFKGGISLKKYFDEKKLDFKFEATGNKTRATPKSSSGNKGETTICNFKVSNGIKDTTKGNAGIYSTDAMACRRVFITKIDFTPKVPETKKEVPEEKQEKPKTISVETWRPKKPSPTISIEKKEREGISKIVLRKLLTECDYFSMIEETNPFIYDSIKQKVKYFNPAFHSMTPEGLNARLNFLNQCVRPGETIPVIDPNGNLKSNDALNTSFGTPPILILRIGDFYHTKIIPETMGFSYEPLHFDMNPEGIGVQPMLVNVSLGFKMIGGHGLAKPIEQLQNALSFNYYANTEIYDERAVPTEDTSVLDKEILQSIINKEKNANVNDVDNKPENRGGTTIGTIIKEDNVEGGSEGIMSYVNIMDSLVDTTKDYFINLINKLETTVNTTNYGVLQILNEKRNYISGSVGIGGGVSEITKIWGKSTQVQEKIDGYYKSLYSDILSGSNPIISKLININGIKDDNIREIKTNMTSYIKGIESEIPNAVFPIIQDIVTQEQDFVQVIRKTKVVTENLIDGDIKDTGNPKVYKISEEEVEKKDNYSLLKKDMSSFVKTMDEFNELIIKENILTDENEFTPIRKLDEQKNFGTTAQKVFFVLMSRHLMDNNNVITFINKVIQGPLLNEKDPVDLYKEFKNIVDDLVDVYSKEIEKEEKLFKKFKSSNSYNKFTNGIERKMFKKRKEKERKLKFVQNQTVQTEDNVKILKDLYSNTNVNTEVNTFNGKIKFD